MLPVYKAVSFNGIIDKGGRTKPWSVLVDTPNGVKPYVVKMFTSDLVQRQDSVANEVLGNVLAEKFDLPVPSGALIEMDEDFRMKIRDPNVLDIYDRVDERLKFGCELIEGNILFNPAFTKSQAQKMIGLDTLFAFDCLIRNRDRNNGKPNLLVKSNSAYLIDHDLGFEIDNQAFEELRTGKWNENFYRYHIFWNYLKRSRKTTKATSFGEFQEYLRTSDFHSLKPYLTQLSRAGYSSARHEDITQWLALIKKNSTNFVNLLKSFIS